MIRPAVHMLVDAGAEAVRIEHAERQGVEAPAYRLKMRPVRGLFTVKHRKILP